jgi:hypothetical protein
LDFNHINLDDATLFFKKVGKTVVYLVVYVDDLLITGNNEIYIASVITQFLLAQNPKASGYKIGITGSNLSLSS